MISYIKGILAQVNSNGIVLENQGIGYRLMMPVRMEHFPKIGQEMKVFTHMHVREDDISLFGFRSQEELETFELLIGVNGIGPKVALSVLSTLTVYELKIAVMSEDVKTISSTPGLGPKGAKKLILELKDKLSFEEMEEETSSNELFMSPSNGEDAILITIEGLESLGYSKTEAAIAVKKVENADSYTPEELLKLALKNIMI
ncbi:Holliday junction branch migration protein RuvA [Anaerostipes sp. MSJ-23]|uniref:Holliday junction branch migration protein RuvA n=1 Tax=unclassified Anaerostipes TaxID=2635253 RepID=UPI001C0F511C|nr:Holliday junction branch migration protein RuvA [Anaerostipes sp. MSJ-23]MBU5458880.1 Holliday junction branch migration protein RuvA [Anaerostipes sp. MSJ-23]